MSFLETCIAYSSLKASPVIWNTLLELYLTVSLPASSPDRRSSSPAPQRSTDKVLALLKNPEASYDVDHALMLAQAHHHSAGLVYLYEKLNRYHALIQYYMDLGEYEKILSTCKRYGQKNGTLRVRVLSFFAQQKERKDDLAEVLAFIDKHNLIPPLRVIQMLAQNEIVPLEVVKSFVVNRIKSQTEEIEHSRKLIASYREETERLQQELDEFKQP